MPDQPTPQVMLVQFKCKDTPISELVRKLKDETLDEWDDRRTRNRASAEPQHHFKHTGVIPEMLHKILQQEKLRLVDAYFQRRIGGNEESFEIRRHILVTFKFAAESPNDKKRQKDLDDRGARVLQAYLAQRWTRTVVASFPDSPGLQSILFVGRAEDPTDPVPIDDEDAKRFGMIITRRRTLQQHAV